MYYAVNIIDLAYWQEKEPIPINLMLLNKLDKSYQIDCEPNRIDGMALMGKTELEGVTEEMWQATIEVIRNGMGRLQGIPKSQLRIYQSKTGKGGWKRV